MAEGCIGLPYWARGGWSDLCCDHVSETSSVQMEGQEMATLPLCHLIESLTLQSDQLLIKATWQCFFAPQKLFWVLNVCTYLKICKESTFWREDIPQLNQNVHLEIWKRSYHLSYQGLQEYGDLSVSPDQRGLLLQATTASGSPLAGGEMRLPVFLLIFVHLFTGC